LRGLLTANRPGLLASGDLLVTSQPGDGNKKENPDQKEKKRLVHRSTQ
jgi:hypothetical protein